MLTTSPFINSTFFQFAYNVTIPQFNFLRLLSLEAKQIFTYKCVNSIGWEDQVNGNMDRAFELMGYNEEVITHEYPDLNVLTDTCKVKAELFLVVI